MKTVYLVCGVPGSGKTWVCEQVEGWVFLEHDEHPTTLAQEVLEQYTEHQHDPILIDCPFGERKLREELESHGFTVKPYFIVESTKVIQERYRQREGRELGKAHVTRSRTIVDRAIEWQAPYGTAQEILDMLRKV